MPDGSMMCYPLPTPTLKNLPGSVGKALNLKLWDSRAGCDVSMANVVEVPALNLSTRKVPSDVFPGDMLQPALDTHLKHVGLKVMHNELKHFFVDWVGVVHDSARGVDALRVNMQLQVWVCRTGKVGLQCDSPSCE
eukprot:scaffold7472_cov430-Prasinococcus_capsulatus_cf.AAC.1